MVLLIGYKPFPKLRDDFVRFIVAGREERGGVTKKTHRYSSLENHWLFENTSQSMRYFDLLYEKQLKS